MVTPKEYFPEKYLKDQKIYIENSSGYNYDTRHICGRVLNEFFKNDKFKKLVDGRNYFICQYELNLIEQIIYSDFREDFELWKKLVPEHAGCRCTYASHPIDILESVTVQSRRFDKVVFTRAEILMWDRFFLEYMKNLCADNNFKVLTFEGMIEAIKNDPDCNNDYVKNYFARLR